MIERNIEQQDGPGLANFTRLLVSYCKPYLEDDEDRLSQLAALKTFGSCDTEDEAFEMDMRRIEVCLSLLREKNLYGYQDVRMGQSNALFEEEEVTA